MTKSPAEIRALLDAKACHNRQRAAKRTTSTAITGETPLNVPSNATRRKLLGLRTSLYTCMVRDSATMGCLRFHFKPVWLTPAPTSFVTLREFSLLRYFACEASKAMGCSGPAGRCARGERGRSTPQPHRTCRTPLLREPGCFMLGRRHAPHFMQAEGPHHLLTHPGSLPRLGLATALGGEAAFSASRARFHAHPWLRPRFWGGKAGQRVMQSRGSKGAALLQDPACTRRSLSKLCVESLSNSPGSSLASFGSARLQVEFLRAIW